MQNDRSTYTALMMRDTPRVRSRGALGREMDISVEMQRTSHRNLPLTSYT
jgi:hypothetical protein